MSSTNNQISNAQAIASSSVFGTSHLTLLKIVVEGTQIEHYLHFELRQSATEHHSFALILSHDSLGNAQNHQLEDAQKLLGKRILITFTYKNIPDSPSRDFVGVITEVGFTTQESSLGNIVITGKSPTILLDSAAHLQSFGGKQPVSLKTIADTIIKEGLDNGKYKSRVEPTYTGNISYACQYDETHYNFLARIAEAYGEQFFYDGKILHFGKLPTPEKPINLIVGREINHLSVFMKARHVKRNMCGYNSSTHEKLTTGSTQISHKSSLAKAAYELSEKTFQTPSLRIAPLKASTNKDVEAAQKSTSGSLSVNVFTTSGTTTVPFLYPGCLVEMDVRKPDSTESSYFTKLMIIEITHTTDALGNYIGNFKAIGADTGYLPTPAFEIPNAEDQTATVIENKDPQGRVQVSFDWQMNGNTSEWIRVMSPDAGSSEQVGKNRGFVAIPEKGDQVMVAFVHGHPDRPYVKGGLFHGKIGGGGGSDNNIKSLTSKSGHTVQLNDGGGITVKDKTGGNHVVIDGNNKITVTSSKTVHLTNNKASITLEDDEITIFADKITLAKSGGESSKIEIKGLDTTLFGKTEVKVQSDTKAQLNSKGTTDIIATAGLTTDATTTTMKSKAITAIQGAMVNIN
ncbi:MAG: Vgr family protein [Pedobacter sp.]|nr:MAG: Vgr family protein [Pedobacter sp.]